MQSHFYLAKRINKKLGKKFNGNFYLGSIAPDFLYQHTKRKHEFKYSFSYILQEIDSLVLEKDLNLVSYKMGIICHYLADFFCKAHNCDKLLNNLWEHFQYESFLHKVLISSKTENHLETEIKDIAGYLKNSYASYLEKNSSVVMDISFSLEVCYNLSRYILQKVDERGLQEIA